MSSLLLLNWGCSHLSMIYSNMDEALLLWSMYIYIYMLFPALVLLRLFDRFSKFQPKTVVVSLHKVSFHKVSLILCPEDVDAPQVDSIIYMTILITNGRASNFLIFVVSPATGGGKSSTSAVQQPGHITCIKKHTSSIASFTQSEKMWPIRFVVWKGRHK